MSLRRFNLVWLAAVVVAAVACGSETKTQSSATTAPGTAGTNVAAAPSSAAPLSDLIVGIPADTTLVSPPERATVGMGSPNANMYEQLVRMDSNFQLQPWLAEKWEFVAPNTWKFTLRKDVKFHDGSSLTAKDAAWTFDRIAKAGGRAINAKEGGTKVIDDFTFEYTPGVPNLKIPLQVVHPIYGIMKANSDPVAAPMGTGPFKFISYKPKEELKVERVEGYWDKPNTATVKSITFKYIPDNNARVSALRAGDVDIITQMPRESVAQVKGDSKFRIGLSPVGAYEALSIQVNGKDEWATTAERAVRQAVALGIDRDTIVKQVWEGNAELGRNLIPPAILGAAKDRVLGGPKFDMEAAKKALDDAGWRAGGDGIRVKDGKRLELTLINGFPDPATHKPIPEVIQQQLKRVGIDVKIVETTDYDATLKTGRGHLWLERGNQNDANPAFLPNLLYTSVESGNKAGEDYARAFGIGKKVDEPMAQAQATADVAKTQELTAQAMRALIDEEFVVIPIAGLYNITAYSTKVENFVPHAALIHTDFSKVVKR